MAFEFSHLLQPLAVVVPAMLTRSEPSTAVDLRAGTGEATGGALAVLVIDPASGARPRAIDEPDDDWLVALLASPGAGPVDDLCGQLAPDIGLRPEAPGTFGLRDVQSAGGSATVIERSPALPVGFTHDGGPTDDSPAAEPTPRSRFATPSVDDDLLPIRAKRR